MSKTISNRIPVIRTLSFPVNLKAFPFSSSGRWLHVIFWLGFYLFNALLEGSIVDNYKVGFFASIVKLPLQIGLVYFNLYFLFPKYLLSKKYYHYFLSLIVLLGFTVLIKKLLLYDLVYPPSCPLSAEQEPFITFSTFFLMLNSEVYLIGLTTAIKMSVDWVKNIQVTKALKSEKLEAELGLLKAQIQPHFFFNTLNNLYALTLKKSDQAPGIVQKLSELMSYLLYECDQNRVSLENEIKLIYNYLDLEKLRYGKRLQLDVEIKGDFSGKTIPPFIILPFVENAFKHGQANLSRVLIKISLLIEKDQLLLRVKNPVAEGSPQQAVAKGGIGLKNVKRRLQLLYGTNYVLQVQNNQKEYQVSLRIPLNHSL